jgi:hypothetical protein
MKLVTAFALLISLTLPTSPAVGENYEKPPIVLQAADQLPAEVLTGDHHRIVDEVDNDGYVNHYTIESDFGSFAAHGNAQVLIRVKEIEAIAQLKEVSRTEAFAEAAKRSASKDVEAAKAFADHPVETAKGVPGGISRLAKKTSRRAKDLKEEASEQYADYKQSKAEKEAHEEAEAAAGESADEAAGDGSSDTMEDAKEIAKKGGEVAEDYALDSVGYTGARRYWAKKLGVDPYSDNGPLNKQLNRVAQAAAAGGFTMRFVPIPSLDILDYMGDIDDLVWDMDELDLRLRNEKLLYDRGYSEEGVERLYDNKAQTPTLITMLVDALVRMDGVDGRVAFLEKAATAETRDVARMMVRTARFYAAFHENDSPIAEFHGESIVPVAKTADGRVIVALAVDYLSWTTAIGNLFEKHSGLLTSIGGDIEFWLEGGCSERAKSELEGLGFALHTHSFAR